MTAPLTADAHEYGLVGDGVADDGPALQKLVDALGDATAADGRPRTVRVPAGRYAVRDRPVLWRSGVSLVGAGRGATCFELSNPGAPTRPVPLAWFTTAQHGAGRDRHIADVTFAHFEIDGLRVETEEYEVWPRAWACSTCCAGASPTCTSTTPPPRASGATSSRTPWWRGY